MTFTLNEEQQLLKDAARDFCAEQAPVSRLRKVRDDKKNGRDPELWRAMAQLGWAGVIIPEEFGGSGLGFVALGAVLEQTGRTLVSSPLLSTALIGASALLLGGSDAQKKEWLPKIAEGKVIVALAVDEGSHHTPGKSDLEVRKDGAVLRLDGTKQFVAEGHIANLFIVVGADLLYLVKADQPAEPIVSELITVDSRGAADIKFIGTAAETLGGPGLVDQLLDRARVGLAAEMLGQAQASFEITTEYLKTRKQFGHVIGGFQALQHRAAKLFTDIELTRSCVYAALDALDRNANSIPEYASLAKARAGETVHLATNELVQMHGGIGMTDAHDAGLYLKRARVAEALYGSAAFHRDRYASLLGF